MIRTLQKKFVVTAMIAVTVLMLLMLGVLNAVNRGLVEKEVERTLHVIAENEGNMGGLRPVPGSAPPGAPVRGPKNEYDTLLSSNFFVVRFSQNGEMVYVDVSRTSSLTEEEAKTMAQEAYTRGKEEGKNGKFRYLLQNARTGPGATLVFLDVSAEGMSTLRVLLLSAAIGLVCWGLMLVLVILLSKKAIRPIAENIERQKQFVTNAGHEIKTPLAIIQANTEAMELYTGETKWSRHIKEQTARLSGLMQTLLLLARMDEGAWKTQAQTFSLSDTLDAMAHGFAQPMEAKGIALETAIQPDVSLCADRGQMEQLVSILLDNAVKYANQNGTIRLRLQKEEKQVLLEVRNTCERLPSAPPDKLFDRFYRADTARTQKDGGYGIGLSMARWIARANQGTIEASYMPPDTVCFTVRLESAQAIQD